MILRFGIETAYMRSSRVGSYRSDTADPWFSSISVGCIGKTLQSWCPGKLADRFVESGFDVDDLADRRVRVRGVIEESGGPAIRIGHPIAIEVLDER